MEERCGKYLPRTLHHLGYRTFGIGKFHTLPPMEDVGYEVHLRCKEVHVSPQERQQDAYAAFIDREGVSEAVLNGQRLGVRWYGRHLYELGDAIRPGRNVLEVTVTTTLFNYCRALTGNAAAQYWVKKSRPGETPDLSPAPVGILGPVQLVGVRRSASSWQIDRSRRARRRAEGTPAGPYRA